MSIIKKAQNGDISSFEALIEMQKVQMYKTAKAILKNEDDVCDAIQETLISAYKNIANLKNENYFKTWIIRITINKCYDLIQKNNLNSEKNEKTIFYEESESQGSIETKMDLESAIKQIDDDLRVVTVLYYYDDIPVKEISKMLNIPPGTVKSKLSRARDDLYNILKEKEVTVNEQKRQIYTS